MVEKFTGTITRWQNDKGFGFIQLDDNSGKELFFHISDYRANERPVLQEAVVFELGIDKKGQPCAKNLQQASFVQQKIKQQNLHFETRRNSRQVKQTNEFGINGTLIFGVIFLLALVGLCLAKVLPAWVLAWYGIINVVSFLWYLKDKNAAQHDGWRVSESSLHNLAILGGWIGAGVAHKTLRHKSQKREFRQMFYWTILGNVVLLGVIWYFKLR